MTSKLGKRQRKSAQHGSGLADHVRHLDFARHSDGFDVLHGCFTCKKGKFV